MKKNIIKFPQPASPNIEEVLKRFLDNKRTELKSTTIRKYEGTIDLFQLSMNSYAYQALNPIESKYFDHYYHLEGEAHKEFCQVFGPEKVPENINEFLGYFMVRKVICGRETKKSAKIVINKLCKWLKEQGFIHQTDLENVDECV